MNPSFLSHQDLTFQDPTDPNFDVSLEDIDFDISIDDLDLLPFNEFESHDQFCDEPTFTHALKSTSPEFLRPESSPATSNHSRVLDNSEDLQNSVDVSSYFNVEVPENHEICIDRLNVLSPESNGSNKEDSLGSGNSNSVTSSTNFDGDLTKKGVVDQKIMLDGYVKDEDNCSGDRNTNTNTNTNTNKNKNCLLKRKQGSEDSSNVEIRTNKYHKLSTGSSDSGENGSFGGEEDKRKARLVRNRESAHLSRQRKKQYVEELEDKVKAMHSTIHDLNAKVSYIMAENVTLRQQMGGGGVPPNMAPPPGMYPTPTMMYPWMPAPPYLVKPHGSHVPLVPIPRLKQQQSLSVPKTSKKGETKKNEGKSKKVASVSFLGLLFFMMLFGGLVPMVNVRYGRMKDALVGGQEMNMFYERGHGRVLTVSGKGHGESFHARHGVSSNVRSSQEGYGGEPNNKHAGDEFVGAGNGSEPLMASLYVPRNDKLVKIDGNLIIHSVLASDKSMAAREINEVKKSDETGLAVPGDVASSISRRNTDRHPHLALGSGAENENSKSPAADHSLQQWFREGLAGPMLSSGMCTEVFQFEVSSASGAIIPATSSTNVSAEDSHNSTHVSKGGRNRRILHGIPIPLPGSSAHNISEDRTRGSGKRNYTEADSSASSMVVSVLVDPREAANTEGDGVMGQKSLSRIFVVVLIDSVKYVTYSCMLPFKGSFPHLVTT